MDDFCIQPKQLNILAEFQMNMHGSGVGHVCIQYTRSVFAMLPMGPSFEFDVEFL